MSLKRKFLSMKGASIAKDEPAQKMCGQGDRAVLLAKNVFQTRNLMTNGGSVQHVHETEG